MITIEQKTVPTKERTNAQRRVCDLSDFPLETERHKAGREKKIPAPNKKEVKIPHSARIIGVRT